MNNNSKIVFALMGVGIVIFSLVIIFIPLGNNSSSLLGGSKVVYSVDTSQKQTAVISQKKPLSLLPFLITNTQSLKGFLVQGKITSNNPIVLKLLTDNKSELGRINVLGQGEFTGAINLPTEAILILQKSPLVHFVLESIVEQNVTISGLTLSSL